MAASRPVRVELEAEPDEWPRLAEQSGNVFATPEWLTLWWKHFAGEDSPRLYAVRDGDRLAALLPLHHWRSRRPRTLRFAGHGPSDLMGPICAPGDLGLAVAGLEEALARESWDVLLAERLASREVLPASLAARELLSEPSPVLGIHGMSWDEFLASKSSNFRQQVRRRERKLVKDHKLSFRLADDPERLDADLELLFRLHEERWGARGSGALRERRSAFHREFAHVALERGWLRLWLLELGGHHAAAWYGLRFAGRELYYQAGRDPALEKLAVGFVLLAHTVREAMNDGMREYDFLRGGEGYKDRFTTDDTQVRTFAVGRGPLGRVAVATAPRARRLLRGRL